MFKNKRAVIVGVVIIIVAVAAFYIFSGEDAIESKNIEGKKVSIFLDENNNLSLTVQFGKHSTPAYVLLEEHEAFSEEGEQRFSTIQGLEDDVYIRSGFDALGRNLFSVNICVENAGEKEVRSYLFNLLDYGLEYVSEHIGPMTILDFDGDGESEVVVYRASANEKDAFEVSVIRNVDGQIKEANTTFIIDELLDSDIDKVEYVYIRDAEGNWISAMPETECVVANVYPEQGKNAKFIVSYINDDGHSCETSFGFYNLRLW